MCLGGSKFTLLGLMRHGDAPRCFNSDVVFPEDDSTEQAVQDGAVIIHSHGHATVCLLKRGTLFGSPRVWWKEVLNSR